MREIKFRAWDKINGDMYYYGNLINGDVMLLSIEGGLQFSDEGTWEQEDFILMEYTGLKDKNGKEIYEGDIIMLNNNSIDLSQVCFGEFGVRSAETEEVIDIAIGWYMKVIPTDAMSRMQPFCYDMALNQDDIEHCNIEIIGNIYSNSELLEG